MSSDSRYMYPPPHDVAPQYAYPPYAAYDAAQYPPSSSRAARNGAPAPQPPPHAPPAPAPPPPSQPAAYSAPPPPGYPQHPPYPPAPYGAPPPPAPAQNAAQWAPPPEGWPPYPQTAFVPPAQDAAPPPPGEAGAPSASGAYPPENRRAEERPERASEAAPAPRSRKGKDKDTEKPAPTPASPAPAPGLDYHRLAESYRVILESASAIQIAANAGRNDGMAESVEQMLQAALYGHEALDVAVQRSASETAQAAHGGERSGEGGEGSTARARQASISRPDQPVEGGQTCLGCGATSTPEWRRGPMGPRTLCNACGLVYAKLIKKRTREPRRSRGSGQSKHGGPSHPDAMSSGDDGSDDDSTGSPDRRSDPGDAARR